MELCNLVNYRQSRPEPWLTNRCLSTTFSHGKVRWSKGERCQEGGKQHYLNWFLIQTPLELSKCPLLFSSEILTQPFQNQITLRQLIKLCPILNNGHNNWVKQVGVKKYVVNIKFCMSHNVEHVQVCIEI